MSDKEYRMMKGIGQRGCIKAVLVKAYANVQCATINDQYSVRYRRHGYAGIR